MPHDWQQVLAKIGAENHHLSSEPPEEVVKVFHHGIVDSGAGMDGQVFSVWFLAAADIRYVAAYCYQIVRLAEDPSFTLEQLRTMARTFLPMPAEFSAYCGMHTLWDFTQLVLEAQEQVTERSDFLELINTLLLYASHLNA